MAPSLASFRRCTDAGRASTRLLGRAVQSAWGEAPAVSRVVPETSSEAAARRAHEAAAAGWGHGSSAEERGDASGASAPAARVLGTGATSCAVLGGRRNFHAHAGDSWQASGGNMSQYPVHGGAASMRAAVLWEPNGAMTVEQLNIPRPQAEEVLIRTRACGVCHTDLHVILGDVPFPTPCVLGHEVSGEIVEHGPGTSHATRHRLPVGSQVVAAFIMPCGSCHFCNKGKEDLCDTFFTLNRGKGQLYDGTTRLFKASDGGPVSMYSMGGLADFCAVPSTAVARLHPGLPVAESAIIGCALFTAYGAVRNAGDVRAGMSVAVIGAGGVGSGCIQMAKASGASTIIAVDLADKKLEGARSLGATHSINASGLSKGDVAAAVRELTGGRGVDVAIEALGRASTFETAVESVADGGKAVMVGIAPVGEKAGVEVTRIVRRNISIVGSYGARARADLPTILALAASGQINVTGAVQSRHSLEEASAVYEALGRGEVLGRAIIDMEA